MIRRYVWFDYFCKYDLIMSWVNIIMDANDDKLEYYVYEKVFLDDKKRKLLLLDVITISPMHGHHPPLG